jgi:chromate reductase, NAD(P)H dehydrogenase (quinone)
MPEVLVICGSLRKGSYNAIVVRTLPELAPAGMTLKAAKPFDTFPFFNADIQASSGFPADVQAFAEDIRAADGVLFVTPEYNFSIPGALKNALDWVSRMPNQPFKDKPIAIQSASTSPVGGARMQYHLRQTMVFLEALVFTKPEIFIAHAATKFDEKAGTFTDQTGRDLIKKQLEGFAHFIERIRPKK